MEVLSNPFFIHIILKTGTLDEELFRLKCPEGYRLIIKKIKTWFSAGCGSDVKLYAIDEAENVVLPKRAPNYLIEKLASISELDDTYIGGDDITHVFDVNASFTDADTITFKGSNGDTSDHTISIILDIILEQKSTEEVDIYE